MCCQPDDGAVARLVQNRLLAHRAALPVARGFATLRGPAGKLLARRPYCKLNSIPARRPYVKDDVFDEPFAAT